MADVDELTRRARRAESDGELRDAVRLYRRALESDPDQEVAVRAARLLDREGRTGEALDVLRETWERRTGRRLPAGDIERAARRLDPDADLASWTPEWPPEGEDREPPERVARASRTVEPGAGGPAGGGRRPAGREPPRGDGAEEGGPGGEDGGGEEPPTPSRRFVRRYQRRPGGQDAPEAGPRRRLRPRREAAETASGDDGGADGPARPGGEDGDTGPPEPVGANGTGDLRRGVEVLEELLRLAPRDRRLRRRKVKYARRLGDRGLLEEALVELGDLLEEEGAHRGARLLREEAGWPEASGDPGPSEGDDGEEDVDEGFRRRLSEALEQAPRELERLQAAGMEALGAEDAGAVPWRAHRELGRYLLLRGRPDEAARHLAAAFDRAPEEGEATADALFDLGLAHRRAGRRDDARRCFDRLADRDPGFAVAWEAVSA